MPATAPSLPRSESRRRQVLAAVLRVVAAGGVDAVTHRRVAAEAGVSLGSTSYHFGTRDELILEAFRFLIASQMEQMTAFERSSSGGPEDIIDLLVNWTEREFADRDALVAEYELILYAARDERLAREYWAWQRSLESLGAEALEQLGAPRPMEAARALVGLVRAYELERLAHRETGPDELRRRLELVLTAFVNPPQGAPS